MFGKPAFGWVHINIEKFDAPASYLTDVCVDALKNMIYALDNKSDFIISLDAEGWTYKIISDCYRTIILVEKDLVPDIFCFDKTMFDLAKEIYSDINNNKEDWFNWPCFLLDDDISEEERETSEYHEYKEQVNNLLGQLCERIKKC